MDIPKPDNLHESLNMSKFRESWTGNAIKEASEEMVNKFCDIDYHNEIAVIAESDSNSEKRNVGVVRLAIGRERGLKSVYGIVMADNTRMLTLAKELAFSVGANSFGEVRIERQL